MRRLLLPGALVLVALVAGATAVLSVPEASGAPPLAGTPASAPVLTARRVPVLLATPVGERRLVDGLSALAAEVAEPSCLEVSEGERPIFADDPEVAVIPASNTKLVTAASVLAHLDASEVLTTTVEAAAPVVDGVLAGDLFLVGGGDPVLGTEAWERSQRRQPALRTPIEVLADRVAATGLRSVQGAVVGDESRYDATRWVETWPARYRGVSIGPMSALNVDDGFTGFEGNPTSFSDPPSGAAGLFTVLLRQRGIEVVADPAAGVAPATAVEVASIDSPPVLELVGQMLRESDNGTAELLTKEVGYRVAGEGSTAAGTEVAEDTLDDLGLAVEGVDVVDGSGLDRGNRLTCGLLHDLLVALDAGGEVEGGLAVAGVTGTLAQRFLDSPVNGRLRAKTGSLNNVSSLAGYADTRNEGELTFSFVMNGLGNGEDPTPYQATLAELLISYPDVPDLDELGPRAWPGLSPPG